MHETELPIHPAAGTHLPFFVAGPGQTDVLFNAMVIFMLVAVFAAGLLYLRLHALPEQLAHGSSKFQFQIVGALALLALFTHNNLFWIAALLIALVRFPDFATPLNSMAHSLDAMARREPPRPAAEVLPTGEVVPPAERESPVRERRA